jgi:hypothetical protein
MSWGWSSLLRRVGDAGLLVTQWVEGQRAAANVQDNFLINEDVSTSAVSLGFCVCVIDISSTGSRGPA